MEVKFLKVDVKKVQEYGTDVAILVAYLVFIGRKLKKDDHGYFCFDANYACRGLGWSRNKLHYVRRTAIEYGLIDCILGHNQNEKPRYRIK